MEHLLKLAQRNALDLAEKFLPEPGRNVVQGANVAGFDFGDQIFLAEALLDEFGICFNP